MNNNETLDESSPEIPPLEEVRELQQELLDALAREREKNEILEQESREREQLIAKLADQIQALKRDALTGLENRHALSEKQDQRKASGRPWSVLILDIDFFKTVNDTIGHNAGDAVLQQAARYLEGLFRNTDSVIRYGGEEFAVIIKNATPEDILRKQNIFNKDEMRPEIGFEAEFKGVKIPVRFSGGITSFAQEEEIEDAITRADGLLYFSKENGRNRISRDEDVPQAAEQIGA